MDPSEFEADDLGTDLPEAVDLSVTSFTDPVHLADFVLEVDDQLQKEEREPTTQIGDFVFSSHERLTARGGTYRNSVDQYSKKLGTRSMGSGDDVDYAYEAGLITARYLPVPGFRLVKRALKPFRLSWQEGEGKDAKARQLAWSEVRGKLKDARDALKSSTDPEDVDLYDRLVSLLGDEDRMALLRSLYGSSIQMVFYIQHWAQGKGNFDLQLASFGKTYWVLDRQSSDAYTHRYRGAFAPTKTWLDEAFKKYFDLHPLSEELLELINKSSPSRAHLHKLGLGDLRHYSYNEIWHQDQMVMSSRRGEVIPNWSWDESLVTGTYRTNLDNWRDSWRLRYHLWEAFKWAFLSWSLNFQHCVEANNALERTLGVQDEIGYDFASVENNDPFEEITGNRYFNTFVQPPVSFEYMLWQMVENLVQFKRRRTAPELDLVGTVLVDDDGVITNKDGFWEEDRIKALELAANVFSWMERLPRCWKDGKIYWAWYTRPDHEKDGKHCNGCQHWDKNLDGKGHWVPTHLYNPEVHEGWIREEAQIWYATRQEQQLFRKAIFTHNTGSGNMDATVDALLTVQAIVDFRHKYGGGGRERIPPETWWTPPGVSPEFWLGVVYEHAQKGDNRPWNGWMLQSNSYRLEVQNSRSKSIDHLSLNTTSLGVDGEDIKKKLVDVYNFDDSLVFPTGSGEKEISEHDLDRLWPRGDSRRLNPWGHAWVDFRPRFDPLHPKMVLVRDTFFALDPLWYNTRSYFDDIQITKWIEAFEDAFPDGANYTITWPDGNKDTLAPQGGFSCFRDPRFRYYLISHYFMHKDMLLEFYENQSVGHVVEEIERKLARINNNGVEKTRPSLYKWMDGLPNSFNPARQKLYQSADIRIAKSAAAISQGMHGYRGLTFGWTLGHSADGYGRGYGTERDQFALWENLNLMPLYCRYWDNIVGLIEAAEMDPEPETIGHLREHLAKLLAGRGLNWSHALKAAELSPTFFKLLPSKVGREERPEHALHAEHEWEEGDFVSNILFGDYDKLSSRHLLEASRKGIIWKAPENIDELRAWDVEADFERMMEEIRNR